MRPIKFRGFTKELVKNEWVYGNLIKRDNGECIIIDNDFRTWDISHDGFQVEPETIGQFTGLYDKNGKEIYEGDIIKWVDSDGNERIDEVKFIDGGFRLCNINYTIFHYPEKKIIGNIHENPELLEQ